MRNTYSNILEAHANDEVGSPVGTAGDSHCSWPWTLREQLGYKEPGDGTWTNLKEGHKAEDGQHTDVAHPRNALLSGGRQKKTGLDFCRENIRNRTETLASFVRLTNKARATVMMMAQKHIPPSPSMWRVRRPILSIRKSCQEEENVEKMLAPVNWS